MAAEKTYENKIKKFLTEHGAWFVKYWAGATYTKNGIPDILACVCGCFIAIEVKAPNGKPSPLQIHNLKMINNAGGFALLLYPDQFDLFKELIRCLECNINANPVYEQLKARWKHFENKFEREDK